MSLHLQYFNENYADNYASEVISFRSFLNEATSSSSNRPLQSTNRLCATLYSNNTESNSALCRPISQAFARAKLSLFKNCYRDIDDTPPMGLTSHNYAYALDKLCTDPQYKSVFMRSLEYDNFDLNANLIETYKRPALEIEKDMQRLASCDITSSERKNIQRVYSSVAIHGDLKSTQEMNNNHAKVTADPAEDLCVSMSVCIGYPRPLLYHEIRLGRLFKSSQEIRFLGTQTLQDVKEAISCSEDLAFDCDFTNSIPKNRDYSKMKYPSSFFFIHNTFFVDKRFPESKLMGEQAKEFLNSQGRRSMKIKYMQDIRLADITCQLGEPYIYIHQGRCEHLLILRNVYHRQRSERTTSADYPLCTYFKKFKSTVCRICEEKAVRIILASDLKQRNLEDLHTNYGLNDSPCFLCNTCFANFAMDGRWQKIFPFISAPFLNKNSVQKFNG